MQTLANGGAPWQGPDRGARDDPRRAGRGHARPVGDDCRPGRAAAAAAAERDRRRRGRVGPSICRASWARDERGCAQPGGAPGGDDRDAARRRAPQHRRGRRGPRVVPTRPRRRGATPGSSRSRRPASASPRRTSRGPSSWRSRSPRAEARRGRPAAGEEGDPGDRRPSARPDGQPAHQPAPAPRHLLDRGPRPAHRRPPGGSTRPRGSG